MKTSILNPVLLALSMAATTLAFTPIASAALSGSCGMLAGLPAQTGQVNSSYPTNVMAIIDFSTSQVTYTMNNVTTDSSGNPVSTTTSKTGPLTFNSTAGLLPGSTEISFTDPNSTNTIVLDLLPVNSGNTILVQGRDSSFHGVCQMM